MNRLTLQERFVICAVLGLLLTGWVVKQYRLAEKPTLAAEPAK